VQIFQAFGGDWLALGLAGLLAPTPFMTLYVASQSWPHALAAGLVALAGGAVVHLSPPLLRMFMLFAVFAWLLTRRLQKGKDDGESSQNVVAESWLE
jgi:4-hydroxybenzoate polyprenyltransferase